MTLSIRGLIPGVAIATIPLAGAAFNIHATGALARSFRPFAPVWTGLAAVALVSALLVAVESRRTSRSPGASPREDRPLGWFLATLLLWPLRLPLFLQRRSQQGRTGLMVFAVANTLAYFATLVPMVEAAHARQIRIDGTLIGVRQVLETIDEMRTIYLLTEVYRGSTPDARYPEVSDIDTLVRLVLNRGVPRESRGRDAWGNPYVVSCGGDHFEMISLGRDGIAEREPIQGWTLDFDGDIVMRDGVVVRAPFDPRDRSSHAIAEISWMPDEGR